VKSAFLGGMAALVQYVAGKGGSVGLYTTPGNYTCAGAQGGGEPGSYGHVRDDVDLWVNQWGIGFLKDCVCNTTKSLRQHAYKDMKQALLASGRSVTYECDPFMDRPWDTLYDVCDFWAVSDDIPDDFHAWSQQINSSYAEGINAHAGSGAGFNSFDYLQVGNGGQTLTEYRAQMSMYAVLAAPLFIGSDVRCIFTCQSIIACTLWCLLACTDSQALPQDHL